jgi:hypothetical protein
LDLYQCSFNSIWIQFCLVFIGSVQLYVCNYFATMQHYIRFWYLVLWIRKNPLYAAIMVLKWLQIHVLYCKKLCHVCFNVVLSCCNVAGMGVLKWGTCLRPYNSFPNKGTTGT